MSAARVGAAPKQRRRGDTVVRDSGFGIGDGIAAVKLTFTLWDTKHQVPGKPLVDGPCAVRIAEDFIWMGD